MNRLAVLVLLGVCCAGCSSSMDSSPLLQPGTFNERIVDDRGVERIGAEFVANTRGEERHSR